MSDMADGPQRVPVTLSKQKPVSRLTGSRTRKVSPRGWYQDSINMQRWVPTIYNSFGLPAHTSCPGSTPFCDNYCYAARLEGQDRVKKLLLRNYRLLQEASTIEGKVVLLREMIYRYCRQADQQKLTRTERIFRIHWDGDFDSLDYASAWAVVIRDNPGISFWVYTRSFTSELNVVPLLSNIPNLAFYLSVDEYNFTRSQEVLIENPNLRVAWCAVDYRSARELAQQASRRVVYCPENRGTIDLMSYQEKAASGQGACITCGICPKGLNDIMFSTSHREDVLGGQQIFQWEVLPPPSQNYQIKASFNCDAFCSGNWMV